MSEYRRFVAYIYQYQDGKKQKNTGYIKADVRNNIWRMQIQMQTGRMESHNVRVYGFVRMAEWIFAIPLGSGESRNGSLNVQLSMEPEKLSGTDYGLKDLQGVWLKDEENGDYISIWDDEGIEFDKFTLELPRREDVSTGEAEAPGEVKVTSDVEVTSEVEATSVKEPPQQEKAGLEQRWQQFFNHYRKVCPFTESEEIQCLQIIPKDISFLGEKEWQFGRNPFLRQGFLRYGYLILGRQADGRFILGVPGVYYDSQDAHLARMYGFPEFRKGEYVGTERIPEGEDTQRFGYWYHFL